MTFDYNAFTSDDITNAVNRQLAASGSKTKASFLIDTQGTLHNIAILRTVKGATLIAPLWSPSASTMGIRGIHRVINTQTSWSVLINGQANRNLQTLSLTMEQGELTYAPKAQYLAYLHKLIPKQTQSFYNERVSWEKNRNPLILDAA